MGKIWNEEIKKQPAPDNQMHMIMIIKCEHLDKSRCFGSLLVWNSKICITTMPKRKDIGMIFGEAIITPHQSGKG